MTFLRHARLNRLPSSCVVGLLIASLATPSAHAAQSPAATESGVNLFDLFRQSFDLFTILLLLGSLVSVTVIIRCFMHITHDAILPIESERRIRQHLAAGKIDELASFVASDSSFIARVLHAALGTPSGTRTAAREQAELAASEQCANWFRKLEPLSIIGNLGPLLGLAGTVWGMIYAFTSLTSTGGQANAAALSTGIAKALFHTLLGLMLALPSLLVYGFYRSKVDKLCTRALVISSELVDALPMVDAPPRPPATEPVLNGPSRAAQVPSR